eukprot:m.133752 g.133752  ORF g.133752 m.133752 type:complete len:683 (-) comp15954_c0_seq2:547-2595(-)
MAIRVALICLALGAVPAASRDIYVSYTHGSDTNNGGVDSPLRTIQTAFKVIENDNVNNTIYLTCDGEHVVSATLTVNASLIDLTIASAPSCSSDRAIVTAAMPVDNWLPATLNGYKVLQAQLPPNLMFTQLFVDNHRRQRARMPRITSGRGRGMVDDVYRWAHHLGNISDPTDEACKQGFVYNNTDLNPNWHNLQDVEILTFHAWDASWHRIDSITASNNTVRFSNNTWTYCVGSQPTQGGQRYIVENVREGLDEPGEWYYDRVSGLLSYYPLPNEYTNNVTAWVPSVETLLQLTDARNVHLESVVWQYGASFYNRFKTYPSVGLIGLDHCERVTIHNCIIQNTGVSGLSVGTNTTYLEVSNTVVQDTGGDGITMSSSCSSAHLHHNRVNSTGHISMWQPAGMRVRGQNMLVEHNDVGYNPYGGILVGWQQGTATPPRGQPIEPSLVVQYNRVHNYGLSILSDFGGIYLSSSDNTCFNVSTCYLPSLIYNNIVSTGRHYNYGSQGIYMDEQVSGQNISHNVFYDIGEAGVYWHCGRSHYTTNNMLLFTGRQAPQAIRSCNSGGNPTWPNLPVGLTFDRNVVYLDNITTVAVDNDYRNASFSGNVYYSTRSPDLIFPNNTDWSTWQKRDLNSCICDPRLADVAAGNWTLLPDSPAWSKGFTPIDLTFETGPIVDLSAPTMAVQ